MHAEGLWLVAHVPCTQSWLLATSSHIWARTRLASCWLSTHRRTKLSCSSHSLSQRKRIHWQSVLTLGLQPCQFHSCIHRTVLISASWIRTGLLRWFLTNVVGILLLSESSADWGSTSVGMALGIGRRPEKSSLRSKPWRGSWAGSFRHNSSYQSSMGFWRRLTGLAEEEWGDWLRQRQWVQMNSCWISDRSLVEATDLSHWWLRVQEWLPGFQWKSGHEL